MKCHEFRELLPDMMEGKATAEQEAHRRSCVECAGLASDLNFITQQALELRAADEPSPRVWNSIEIALRAEGLIRRPDGGLTVVPSPSRRWSFGWLIPLAATFLVTFAVIDYYNASHQVGSQTPVAEVNSLSPKELARTVTAEDQKLLEALAVSAPATRAAYEASLQDVNAYIHDAEESAQNNPNDEDAQQSLVEAYAQKNMLYEMALDRSLR